MQKEFQNIELTRDSLFDLWLLQFVLHKDVLPTSVLSAGIAEVRLTEPILAVLNFLIDPADTQQNSQVTTHATYDIWMVTNTQLSISHGSWQAT